jgi:hypothetical protein
MLLKLPNDAQPQTKGTFSVQYVVRDMKSQVQKTGHSALNVRDSGMNSVLHLKVLSPLCVPAVPQ